MIQNIVQQVNIHKMKYACGCEKHYLSGTTCKCNTTYGSSSGYCGCDKCPNKD